MEESSNELVYAVNLDDTSNEFQLNDLQVSDINESYMSTTITDDTCPSCESIIGCQFQKVRIRHSEVCVKDNTVVSS